MNPFRKCLWANVLLRLSLMAACILLTGSAAFVLQLEEANAAMPSGEYGKDWGDPKGEECVLCHRKHSPGLYSEWNKSKHGQRGVNCLDCHKADGKDKDGFRHKGQLISIIVTPKDCARCHNKEYEENE